MVWLAIDFGERSLGLAISDPEHRFAMPLVTLERTTDRRTVATIAALAEEHGAQVLVIGEPRCPDDGTLSDGARRVHSFARKLAARTGLPIILVEETLTTHAAEERLAAAGIPPEERPGRRDAVAAQILLEEALQRAAPGTEKA